ncbi:ImmA/IrrE family metallo-endopeptidase [Bacillus atrophaeus]|uniref:ImmA/IrrE family metallo-endopeptidase n=1 Tax=Bacillus atrophaeus TaxID=1452 RepID=UPI0022812028|nr:ImmA/IrrE family metallo-endopeptidase [Bacillus atrophaeus]MCY8513501.1 ImmA/IrrE family metallo-endopeptidase [Bacillus atrophaeus]MCY8992605.1 ImmA/IrrE family metallo-endopeptidase [Bacillus atrophaeus]
MYQLSLLEDRIKTIYTGIGITDPSTWDLELIADRLKIIVHYKNRSSAAVKLLGMACIILDSRISKKKQWEDFSHELCHYINHVGVQYKLPPLFRELQENQANAFMYHFAVPSFMLKNIKLAATKRESISLISDLFQVTHPFAEKRLDMHLRKLFSFKYQSFMIQKNQEREKILYANN